jgi:hypothetical protein
MSTTSSGVLSPPVRRSMRAELCTMLPKRVMPTRLSRSSAMLPMLGPANSDCTTLFVNTATPVASAPASTASTRVRTLMKPKSVSPASTAWIVWVLGA